MFTSVKTPMRELTIRSVILGGVITLVFTAANVYLGLKVGLTFATAIPAAVISMSVLRYFRDHSIVENNIVQTIASAAGTLSAIIFVLPGLVMIGWWTGFPYWETVAVCALGGILGVMYSIPLRRALVTGSDLPYPEGVAAAEVLKVGDVAGQEPGAADANRGGMRAIVVGAVGAAVFSLLGSLKLISTEVAFAFRVGPGASMMGASLSLALIGVGHLVGIAVGIAMLVGLVISFFVVLPVRTSGTDLSGDLLDAVGGVFSADVRMVGAGAIAVAAVWTLLTIIGPILKGIMDAAASARQRRSGQEVDVTERDIPIQYVGLTIVVAMIPIGWLLWDFLSGTALVGSAAGILVVSVIFVFVIGLVVAGVCGYMAGLIGSSNSPISGVGVLVVLFAALLIKVTHGPAESSSQTEALIAYTLFTAAVVFGVATISNDNLQDLKTGQLVGATPWKQQVALVIGVLFGSAIIPPILELMHTAFGFQGAPGAGENALAAPQAALLSTLAKGVFGGDLNWALIGLGGAIGAGVIVVDEVLKRTTTSLKLPPLAVGMGMYLPMSLTLIIPIGAILGLLYDRWAMRDAVDGERKKRLGILLATGLIVGESLYGVVFAGIVGATGEDSPLAIVGDGLGNWMQVIGVIVFILFVGGLYRYVKKLASAPAPEISKK
ncbi:OPT family oligopeptide transporter [Gordonia sp. (in: high G+C Gram-positive bacteria)]|uniref:OPT family oligopeptide transporter n=1 Tax=Gordonia sp. (in: high G+C Gram-positive bacteria) TaxID=84139 RepID=UPI001696A18A|nr:oligopeptide transporter, OPT family [Gordonia sp. (in: high G+C Gram-positive bacteria)]NLG47904.1 oligopeptide transporter, OPT family [Gordonia sp. (in: high G+C Gram-positive bacteria)]